MNGRFLMVGVAGAAYVALSQWLMTRSPVGSWTALVIVAPVLALAASLAWQRGWRFVASMLLLAVAALLVSAGFGLNWAPAALYVAQHVAINLALAAAFALTLQPGRKPLITLLAEQVHVALTPAMRVYCRKVTLAWVLFFVAMAAVSLLLYALLSFAVWATFANLLTPVAVAAMFIGEYVLRYQLHPEFERATLRQAIHAYGERRSAAAQAIGDEPALPRRP